MRESQPVTDNVLRIFDSDNNGALDEVELTVLFEERPALIPQLGFGSTAEPAEFAARFLERNES